jgi:protein transport protein SEC24
MIRGMGCLEMSLYLYPRMFALHNLQADEGFADPATGHLKMPPAVRNTFSKIEPGGVYLMDNGQQCIMWFHAQTSPNLIQDLFGQEKTTLQSLDAYTSSVPVLETHLNAQVRNIIEFLKTTRGSKGFTIQLARQGIDGAEYEWARGLVEDRYVATATEVGEQYLLTVSNRNNEAQSYVDWLVNIHRMVQLELVGQRKKEVDTGEVTGLGAFAGLRPSYW